MFTATVKSDVNPGVPNWFLSEIQKEIKTKVGDLIIKSIQDVLGDPSLYTLTPDYAVWKVTKSPKYKHVAGKSAEQPLILSQEHIYDALRVVFSGDTIIVEIDPEKASDRGFDVAAYWDNGQGTKRGFNGVHYMQKGYDAVKDQIPGLVHDIVLEKLRKY